MSKEERPDPYINSIFSCPVYTTKRDSILTPEEERDIAKIVEEGVYKNIGNSTSNNNYIFDDKLKEIKQFCEQQLKIYVEQVIVPKEELDFYITQSWLNITKPGEYHQDHCHANSIISGVFYISTEEDDTITFSDPNYRIKGLIKFEPKEYNELNSSTWCFPVNNNLLLLFPSWFDHGVKINEKATTDRISISFNTFIIGTIGKEDSLNVLNLPDPR